MMRGNYYFWPIKKEKSTGSPKHGMIELYIESKRKKDNS